MREKDYALFGFWLFLWIPSFLIWFIFFSKEEPVPVWAWVITVGIPLYMYLENVAEDWYAGWRFKKERREMYPEGNEEEG